MPPTSRTVAASPRAFSLRGKMATKVKEAEKLVAAVCPGDPARAELWLNSKRGMMPLRDWVAKSTGGLMKVEAAAKRDRRRR